MIHRLYEHYKNPDEERINKKLMNREFEKPIEDYVVDCFSSIQDVGDDSSCGLQIYDRRR